MFHKSMQYALEKLGKSKSGFERTVVSKFKRKRRVGSGNELVDYSRAPCLGADQKARGLWERDWVHLWIIFWLEVFRYKRIKMYPAKSADKRTIRFSLYFYYLPHIILRKWLRCFNGNKQTSMFADRYFGFPPLREKANKVLERWRVLAFYGIALCLNATVVLVSACVRA